MVLIKNLPRSKFAWISLCVITILLHGSALYFQYGMDLAPCVKCINQRTALSLVLIFSIIGWLGINISLVRITAIVGWGYSATLGWLQSYSHVDTQLNPNPFFNSCEITPFFPHWLPLHEWLPFLFAAPGDCGTIDWQFMSMSMPQWMLAIFSVYVVIAAMVVLIEIYNFIVNK